MAIRSLVSSPPFVPRHRCPSSGHLLASKVSLHNIRKQRHYVYLTMHTLQRHYADPRRPAERRRRATHGASIHLLSPPAALHNSAHETLARQADSLASKTTAGLTRPPASGDCLHVSATSFPSALDRAHVRAAVPVPCHHLVRPSVLAQLQYLESPLTLAQPFSRHFSQHCSLPILRRPFLSKIFSTARAPARASDRPFTVFWTLPVRVSSYLVFDSY